MTEREKLEAALAKAERALAVSFKAAMRTQAYEGAIWTAYRADSWRVKKIAPSPSC